MLTLTENAREAIHVLTEAGPADGGVRISAGTGGVDSSQPAVTLEVAPAPEPGDEVLDEPGARLFLEPAAAAILGDQTLDAQLDQGAQTVNFFVR